MTGYTHAHGLLWGVAAAFICSAACRATPTAIAPSNTGVLAEVASGVVSINGAMFKAVPMRPFGHARRSGDLLAIEFQRGSSNEVSWV